MKRSGWDARGTVGSGFGGSDSLQSFVVGGGEGRRKGDEAMVVAIRERRGSRGLCFSRSEERRVGKECSW